MSSSTAVLQLHHRDTFERNVTRALAAGAGAGALFWLSSRLGIHVPLPFLGIAATALACVRGDKWDRRMLAALSVVLPAIAWMVAPSVGWAVALAGASAGALMVKSRLSEKGEEGSVGANRPTAMHYVATAAGTAGLAVAGSQVASILAQRLTDVQTPVFLNNVVAGTIVALFAGLGSLGAHIALSSDPVEARCEEVITQLSGEFHDQAVKALSLYRSCGQSLAALPREPAREELARTIQKLTKDAIELAAEWAGVEAQIHDEAHRDLERQVAELTRSAQTARDPIAKKQLELAAQSLTEELGRLGETRLKGERVLAKTKSQVALLERARVALIGMRSAHASVRAAELSAVSRKLNALALSQADEAKLAHEVATSSELAATELAAHDAKVRAELSQARVPVEVSPVAPVSADEVGEASEGKHETIKN